MENMLQELAVVIGTVATIMIVVKSLLKDVLPPLVAKLPGPNMPEAQKVAYSFKAIAVAVGVVLAFTVYKDISYLKWFDFVAVNDWVKAGDHIIIGVAAGLGEKAAADIWDASWYVAGNFFGKEQPNA